MILATLKKTIKTSIISIKMLNLVNTRLKSKKKIIKLTDKIYWLIEMYLVIKALFIHHKNRIYLQFSKLNQYFQMK